MLLTEIPKDLEKIFNTKIDYYFYENTLFLKSKTIDSISLAKYINYKYSVNKVCVKKMKCSKFLIDSNYIKITNGNSHILEIT